MKAQAIVQMLTAGAAVSGAGVSAVKSFGFVPEGHVGVKLRWGKVVRYGCDKFDKNGTKRHNMGDVIYYEPGWRWIIPFTHKFRTVSLLEQILHLPAHEVRLADDMIFHIKAVVNFRVLENVAYKAMYKVDNYHHALSALCVTELRELLCGMTHEELRAAKDINEALLETVKSLALEKWGVEVSGFKLEATQPDAHSQALIQLKQAVELRVKLLQEHSSAVSGINVGMASVLLGMGTVISTGAMLDSLPTSENEAKVRHLGSVPDETATL